MKDYLYKSFDYVGNGIEFLNLFGNDPCLFFLDSSQYHPQRGRYSFIGFDPFEIVCTKGENSLEKLKERFALYQNSFSEKVSPFASGIVGFLSYDYGLHEERIPLRSLDDLKLPDCFFGFYDCILTIDHLKQRLHITSTGLPEKNSFLREKRASARLKEILKRLSQPVGHLSPSAVSRFDPKRHDNFESRFVSNFTKDQYREAVRKALDYIRSGDIYQVNLSQRFERECLGAHVHPVDIYTTLRRLSPSSFGAYFNCGEFQIISSSPERFLRLKNKHVETRPMKGTRPRGDNECQDQRFKQEILSSAKDKAELLMITDLERNDLGKVCRYGTIHVSEMRTLEEYQTVFQTTSTIEGVLKEWADSFDLLKGCFPGGSITGCPKIRAMEIIEELEPTRRGIYTGSMGYVNFNGNMDFNILIRTVLAYPQKLYFQVGAGIVADSIPENEYQETLVKAKAMSNALESLLPSPKYSESKIIV